MLIIFTKTPWILFCLQLLWCGRLFTVSSYISLTGDWSLCIHVKTAPHYNYVITGTVASQITSLTIVYSTVYSDADQRKHQSSASLAVVRGIHRGPVNSPYKWQVTRIMFPILRVTMLGNKLDAHVGTFDNDEKASTGIRFVIYGILSLLTSSLIKCGAIRIIAGHSDKMKDIFLVNNESISFHIFLFFID